VEEDLLKGCLRNAPELDTVLVLMLTNFPKEGGDLLSLELIRESTRKLVNFPGAWGEKGLDVAGGPLVILGIAARGHLEPTAILVLQADLGPNAANGALGHDGNPLAQHLGLLHRVGCENDGPPHFGPVDDVPNKATNLRVQPSLSRVRGKK